VESGHDHLRYYAGIFMVRLRETTRYLGRMASLHAEPGVYRIGSRRANHSITKNQDNGRILNATKRLSAAVGTLIVYSGGTGFEFNSEHSNPETFRSWIASSPLLPRLLHITAQCHIYHN
jgi:hypothetical protein